jgi:RND family efflux transporter MFP subunit
LSTHHTTNPGSAGRRRAGVILSLLALLLATVAVAAVRIDRARERATTPTVHAPVPAVRAAPVTRDRVERRIALEAEVRAEQVAEVAAEVSGRVVERLVEPGQAVRRGQPLVRLEGTALAAEVEGRTAETAAARAQTAAAAADESFAATSLSRDRILFAGGAISREALDRAELQRDRTAAARDAAERSAEAAAQALAAARERLDDTLVRAPWDGAVASVAVEVGDLAAAGRPVARLVREGPFRVVARLPQDALTQVAPGTAVVVRHAGIEHQARVSRVAAGLDPSGLALVEVDLPARLAGLADGVSVRLSLALEAAEGLTVPSGALLEGAGGATVFRVAVADGRPRLETIAVSVLLRGRERAVVEPLTVSLLPGQEVVVEHPSLLMTLASGMEVRLAEPAAGGAPEPTP